jgi:HEAT repeat protein
MAQKQQKDVPIRLVIDALLDETVPFPPNYLRRFSDLEGAELSAMREAWPRVSPSRRVAIMEDLEELTETDTLVLFDNFARTTLTDSEPGVRARAITLLWEDKDAALAESFLSTMQNDSSGDVRAAAASALGKFVYLGELEELSEDLLHSIEDRLIEVARGKDEAPVRRSAVESLGFSSNSEVPAIIQDAYDTNDPDWLASALFAMGRSYDQSYADAVKRMLRHPKANVQLEAVRAAGELELESTSRVLLDLLEEEVQDPELRYATIWALSQIGGEQVRETLEALLEDTDDEEEAEWLENALDNLTLTETGQSMNLLDIDLADEGMLGKVIDLGNLDDDDEGFEDAEAEEEE